MPVSRLIVSVYAKLRGIKLSSSRKLNPAKRTRRAYFRSETMRGKCPYASWHRRKYVDPNCLASTEHRLKSVLKTAFG